MSTPKSKARPCSCHQGDCPPTPCAKQYALSDCKAVAAAKTTSERVEKLRQERADLGLKRREMYAHDDDWPKLQELAAKLQRKRERDAKRDKG